ncbi:speckle-type POZ protein-like [Uloborus diversus]|uniref:speckle-type POZ protein-like n=1 Tax=Uloborus diversus TaxID=327109 RepID=UPI00240A63C4|nr:speckle-type POZ protein-like [Uloborus diversus]
MFNLSSDLEQLRVSERLSDFKLKVGDKEFPVHKAILAARSIVFAAMFESNMTENRQNEVKVTDIEATIISDLLQYMYTGRIPPMSCEKAISLYSASDKYSLEELKGKCVEFMIANLSVSNVCVVSTLADYHMDDKLKAAINVFMRQHASEVVQSKQWKMFVRSKPHLATEILESVVVDDCWEALL